MTARSPGYDEIADEMRYAIDSAIEALLVAPDNERPRVIAFRLVALREDDSVAFAVGGHDQGPLEEAGYLACITSKRCDEVAWVVSEYASLDGLRKVAADPFPFVDGSVR